MAASLLVGLFPRSGNWKPAVWQMPAGTVGSQSLAHTHAWISELAGEQSLYVPLKTFGSTAVFPPGRVAVACIGESAGAGDASDRALKSASCGMNGLRTAMFGSVA